MKTVLMKNRMQGPHGTFNPGQHATLDDETADMLVSGGHATLVKEKPAFVIADRDAQDDGDKTPSKKK